jgi:hypothetical protein
MRKFPIDIVWNFLHSASKRKLSATPPVATWFGGFIVFYDFSFYDTSTWMSIELRFIRHQGRTMVLHDGIRLR